MKMKRKTYLASAAALALLVAVPVAATHQNHGLRGAFSGQGVSTQNYVAAGSWQHQRLQAQLAAQQAYSPAYAAPAQGEYYVPQPAQGYPAQDYYAQGYASAPEYVHVETTPKKKKRSFLSGLRGLSSPRSVSYDKAEAQSFARNSSRSKMKNSKRLKRLADMPSK